MFVLHNLRCEFFFCLFVVFLVVGGDGCCAVLYCDVLCAVMWRSPTRVVIGVLSGTSWQRRSVLLHTVGARLAFCKQIVINMLIYVSGTTNNWNVFFGTDDDCHDSLFFDLVLKCCPRADCGAGLVHVDHHVFQSWSSAAQPPPLCSHRWPSRHPLPSLMQIRCRSPPGMRLPTWALWDAPASFASAMAFPVSGLSRGRRRVAEFHCLACSFLVPSPLRLFSCVPFD